MKAPNSKPSKLTLAFSLGGIITSNIVGGVVVGYLLDRWLKTAPWLLLVGIVFGSVGAFAGLYRIVSRLNEK
ncbi:MAG: AtpZ/AtpI family protein [Acidobacteriota bacterium]|nr:AtpZ/AtpI family protein [Acidobacteriota bacterium]